MATYLQSGRANAEIQQNLERIGKSSLHSALARESQRSLAMIYFNQGRYDMANIAIKKAITNARPKKISASSYYMLVVTSKYLSKDREAKTYLRKMKRYHRKSKLYTKAEKI